MKKVIFAALALAVIGIFIVKSTANVSSSLLQQNVEALAQNVETEEASGEEISCFNIMSSTGDGLSSHRTYCGDCQPALCKWIDNPGTCTYK